MTSRLKQPTFLNPAICFSVACVAFSLVALSTVWRHSRTTREQSPPQGQAEVNGRSRAIPARQQAVDSIDPEPQLSITDRYQPYISELIALSARVQQAFNRSDAEGDQQLFSRDASSEILLLTVALCRLQHELWAKAESFSTAAGLQACLDAALMSLRMNMQLLDKHFPHNQAGVLGIGGVLEQLQAQRVVLELVMNSISDDIPPTPHPHRGFRARHLEASVEMTPTGITPGIEEIEPPPEYSPPDSSRYPVVEEKPGCETDASSPERDVSPPDASALYDAVNTNDPETLSRLLLDGADPTLPFGELQRTPLHLAAHLNHCICAGSLLKSGADMSTPDARGDTALHLAAWAGNVEVLSILLTHGADVDWLSGRDGYSPLWCAISSHQIDAARLLLKHGARVSLRAAAGSGMMPLHQAAVTGQSAMCELLLDRGAQVDCTDDDKNTPLHYAASSGSVASVQALLRRGVDIEARQAYGLTAVHWAAHKGHILVLSVLHDHGARLDQRAEDGATPLHIAAARGHVAAVKLLIERDAIRRAGSAIWDGIEGTPAEMAKQRGHSRLVRILRA